MQKIDNNRQKDMVDWFDIEEIAMEEIRIIHRELLWLRPTRRALEIPAIYSFQTISQQEKWVSEINLKLGVQVPWATVDGEEREKMMGVCRQLLAQCSALPMKENDKVLIQ